MTDFDRLPPHNTLLEECVLGLPLRDAAEDFRRKAMQTLALAIVPTDFYSPANRSIYEAMLSLYRAGVAVDLVSLSLALQAGGIWESIGGVEFLDHCLERAPSTANALYDCQALRALGRRREVIAIGTETMRGAYDESLELDVTLAATGRAVAQALSTAQTADVELSELAEQAIAELRQTKGTSRWETGIGWLDWHTGGLGHDQGWVVSGYPGHCKTAFALQAAWGILNAGGTVCLFRYEERETAMLVRLASLVSEIPYADARLGHDKDGTALSEPDRDRFDSELRRLGHEWNRRLLIYRGLSAEGIEGAIAKHQPWLCIYDTIQGMALQWPAARKDAHSTHAARAVQFIVDMRGRYRHAALVVSQLSREGMERETSAIVEAADVVIELRWPHKENQEHLNDRIIARIKKNRLTGDEPTLVSTIHPGTQRFGRLVEGEEARSFLSAVR